MAAGYSGTPLARKLGIKEGQKLGLACSPEGWEVGGLPDGVVVSSPTPDCSWDVVVAFFADRTSMAAALPDLSLSIDVNGALWLAWPRRAGGHRSDITDSGVRELALPMGLVDVKVAALDNDWSGLKFVWRKELRPDISKARST